MNFFAFWWQLGVVPLGQRVSECEDYQTVIKQQETGEKMVRPKKQGGLLMCFFVFFHQRETFG